MELIMVKNIDKSLMLFVIGFLAIGITVTINKRPEVVPIVQPPAKLEAPPKVEEKKEDKKEEEKEEPKTEEVTLPAAAILQPLATVYQIVDGEPVKINVLKPARFTCQVLKKIVTKTGNFYMVKVTQLGFRQETHIVQDVDLAFIQTKK